MLNSSPDFNELSGMSTDIPISSSLFMKVLDDVMSCVMGILKKYIPG